MAHTFLALDMNLIPQATKDNVPTFYSARFSNDMRYMLMDGKGIDGYLVHSWEALLSWLQWESDPIATLDLIVNNAEEYTTKQFIALANDVNSIWYVELEGLI